MHRVKSRNAMHSFYVLAQTLPWDFDAIYSMPWDHYQNLKKVSEFPGEKAVCRCMILNQPGVFDSANTYWIIANLSRGRAVTYWNNDDGWGNRAWATVFTGKEMKRFHLPICEREGDVVEWQTKEDE